MSDEKIKYLKHPVSPETKKEWREKGFKIIDARFAPKSDALGKAIAEINGMKKDALIEALENYQADTTGNKEDLTPRLIAIVTELSENGGLE